MTVKFECTTFQNCDYAVFVLGGQAVFDDVLFLQNAYPIYAVDASHVKITNSYIWYSTRAIQLYKNSTLYISDTQINDNTENGDSGAGIFAVQGASVVAENCKFARNKALRGSAVYSDWSSISFTSCRFENNSALDKAGVMELMVGTIAFFKNCSFINNNAPNYGGVFLMNLTTSITISNSSFVDNKVAGLGGVFHLINVNSLNISSSIFQFSNATTGSVISSRYSTYKIYSSSFNNNTAIFGGVAYNFFSVAFSYSSQYFLNSAENSGGAFYSHNSSRVQLYSSTFSSNSAPQGASLMEYTTGFTSLVANCTFEFNIGPAIYEYYSTINIIESKFNKNNGGSCYLVGSPSVVISDSSFSGGKSSYGSAVYLNGVPNFICFNSIFSDNQADVAGGTIYSIYSASKWTNITVVQSRSLYAAISISVSSTCEIDKSKINNNYEGGVMVDSASLLITDSTINNNIYSTTNGGGIKLGTSATVTLKQVRCTSNNARYYGGCVYVAGVTASLLLENCFIGNNSAASGGGIFIENYGTGILICNY